MTIAAIIGSLLYIFSPIDLIPDLIPVAGLLDDAAVLGLCLNGISADLKNYSAWKNLDFAEYEIIKNEPDKMENCESS